MKKWLGFFGALLFSGVAIAQTTIVVGVATDSDSTLWANGTVSVQFVPNPSQPNLNVYRINGAPLSSAVTMQGPISLGSGGSFSVTVYDNTQVTPSGSQWQFTICPQATSKCGSVTTPVSGSGQSITTLIDAAIPAPRFPAVIGNYGYADVEAILQLVPGNIYYNVTNSCYRGYNGSIWGCITEQIFSIPVPITQGGTGATTATGAWANIFTGAGIASNCALLQNVSGTLTCAATTAAGALANLGGYSVTNPAGYITSAGTSASSTNLLGGAVGSAPYQSASNTTAFLASPTTSGHTFVYSWQPLGSPISPVAYDLTPTITLAGNSVQISGSPVGGNVGCWVTYGTLGTCSSAEIQTALGTAFTAVPQKVNTCGTTSTCSNTSQLSPRIVWGTVGLSGGTVTVGSMTAWTSASTFGCTCTDTSTTATSCTVQNTSSSSITIKGTSTDTVTYMCVGN